PLEKPFLEEEPAGPGNSSGNEPGRSRDSAPAPRRPSVTFGDDVDDLVDSLGLGNGADGAGTAQRGRGLRKGRAGIQELLGGGSAGKVLEQPGRAEFRADPKDREQPGPDGGRDEPDFPFGSYEPSVASGTGRRRRFPAGGSSRRPSGAAWLGLKDEDFLG
ncbi:FBF1 factor, partial [Oreocharis arfaki]|nr:FBF1 factor [Oreocharis arfaki]